MDAQEVAVGWWPGDAPLPHARRSTPTRIPAPRGLRGRDALAGGARWDGDARRVRPRLGRRPRRRRPARRRARVRALGRSGTRARSAAGTRRSPPAPTGDRRPSSDACLDAVRLPLDRRRSRPGHRPLRQARDRHGAASGIGVETARALAGAGADVTLAVRNPEAGERVAAEIAATTGNRNVHVAKLDLADRDRSPHSSTRGTGRCTCWSTTPASWRCPSCSARRGLGMQFATNHLGHFALATGLHGALAADGGARIVSVSSSAHLLLAGDLRRHPLRASAPMTRARPTPSPRPRTSCSPSAASGTGPTTASPPTRSPPARSRPTSSATPVR